jgi:hypothetical protein
VIADPGQLGQPDARRSEHREDGRVAALREHAALARLLPFGKFAGVGVLGGFTTFSTYVVGIQRDLDARAPGTALA